MRPKLPAIAICLLACACNQTAGDTAPAADAADPAILAQIEARQENFERISDANKALKAELENSQPDLAAVQSQIAIIVTSADQVATAFPVGSGAESGVETEALPSIWSDPQGFTSAAARFTDQAQVLQQTALTGEVAAIRAETLELGASCRNCHDTFRQPRD
jgi:cytochrome c556